MKNFLVILLLCLHGATQSQISHQGTYIKGPNNGDLYITKFSQAGYKYVHWDNFTNIIDLYNTNHSLYLSINVPLPPGAFAHDVGGISDNLFNSNATIEYGINLSFSTAPYYKFCIFDQNGTMIFSRDSANFATLHRPTPLMDNSGFFYDGISYKMKVVTGMLFGGNYTTYSIYELPGSIPCLSCETFTTPLNVGLTKYENEKVPVIFSPNPAKDLLQLHYKIPEGYSSAEILVTDQNGKIIETFKVTNTFSNILIPSEYNNGLYNYSLYVDGQLIKSEKIILSR